MGMCSNERMTTPATSSFESLNRSAAAILAIPDNEPESLFGGEPAHQRDEYLALLKKWHPDRNSDAQASKVSAHISVLNKKAQEKLAAGTWSPPGVLKLSAADGHVYELRYVKKHAFELGELYVGKKIVAYVLNKALGDDLVKNGLFTFQNLQFADAKMEKEFAGKLPQLIKHFETQDSHVVVLRKDPDMVLLADLRDYMKASTGKPLDPKHVAWITSRLNSFACLLQVNGLTHNGMAADTVFVSPAMHTAALLGGWWYAARESTALKGLPGHAVDVVPSAILKDGKADRRIDLEMIRAVGRDLLGDPTGTLLLRDKSVPPALAHWLTSAAPADAFANFHEWSDETLKRSFGARRFTELRVSFGDIYHPK